MKRSVTCEKCGSKLIYECAARISSYECSGCGTEWRTPVDDLRPNDANKSREELAAERDDLLDEVSRLVGIVYAVREAVEEEG